MKNSLYLCIVPAFRLVFPFSVISKRCQLAFRYNSCMIYKYVLSGFVMGFGCLRKWLTVALRYDGNVHPLGRIRIHPAMKKLDLFYHTATSKNMPKVCLQSRFLLFVCHSLKTEMNTGFKGTFLLMGNHIGIMGETALPPSTFYWCERYFQTYVINMYLPTYVKTHCFNE